MAFIQKARRAYKKSGLKKTYRKVRTMAKKRYSNRSNIAKDVAMLKALVNVEKKRFDVTVGTPQTFAQRNATNDGFHARIISPTPAQGLTGSTRNGNSIKLVSGCLDFAIYQQGNTINNLKIKLWIVCRPENAGGYNAQNTADQLLEPNKFSTFRDFYSNRDPEFFSEFRVIKTMTMELKQDSLSGATQYIQKKVPLKFNHHLKYNSDGSVQTTKNEFYLIATASEDDTNTAFGCA